MTTAWRRIGTWVAVLGGAILLALVAGRPAGEGDPFDPSGTGPLGTKALHEVLRELAVEVSVVTDVPQRADSTLLVAHDRMRDDTRRRIDDWVSDGGTLVVTDPASALNPLERVSAGGLGSTTHSVNCDAPALRDVERLSAPSWWGMGAPTESRWRCVPIGRGFGIVAMDTGEGRTIVVGAPGIVTNDAIGDADNAVAIVRLLAGEGGRVALLGFPPPGSGDESLTSLVSPRAWAALAQLGVAFLVLAWWRSRRLGPPMVDEPLARLPGSELVRAVGDLLQRSDGVEDAARAIARDVRRRLAQLLGMPEGTDPAVIADTAAIHCGWDRTDVRAILEPEVHGDDDLARYSRDVEALVAAVRAKGAGSKAPQGHTYSSRRS